MCRFSGSTGGGKTVEITAFSARLGVLSMTFCRRVTSFLASTSGMSDLQRVSRSGVILGNLAGVQMRRLRSWTVSIDDISTEREKATESSDSSLKTQDSLCVAIVEVQWFYHEIE